MSDGSSATPPALEHTNAAPPPPPSRHGGGSDIYAIAYVAVAHSNSTTTDGSVAGVFAVVHADGTVALVHPDTGHAVARYPGLAAVTIVGSADVIGDPSLVWIGLAKKRGTKCYRAVSRSAAPATIGVDARTAPASSPYDVVLTEVCALASTGEAVVALSAAVARHLGSLLVAAFDTASALRLWQLGSSGASDPKALQATLLDTVQEAVPMYCMTTVRNRDLWCGFEDGTVAVYRLPTTRPKKAASMSPLSSPDQQPRFAFQHDGDGEARDGPEPSLLRGAAGSGTEKTTRSGLVERMRRPQAAPCGVISMASVHKGSRSAEGHGGWEGHASVVMGTEHGDVLVWSSVDFTLTQVLRECHTSAIAAMCAVPSLRQVWSLSTDRTLMIWRVAAAATPRNDALPEEGQRAMSKLLDVSLVGDITGSIFCLCYAAALDTVAGGGSNSELLTWYPRDMASRLERGASDAVGEELGAVEACFEADAAEEEHRPAVPEAAAAQMDNASNDASPVHEPQPDAPLPTPSAPQRLPPLAQQLQLADDDLRSASADKDGSSRARLEAAAQHHAEAAARWVDPEASNEAKAVPPNDGSDRMMLTHDRRTIQTLSAALAAKDMEHQRLLEYVVQLKDDHAQEVAATRQAFADEFQVEVERLRHNNHVTLNTMRANSEETQRRLHAKEAAHAATLELLHLEEEGRTASERAHDQATESLRWTIQCITAERDAARAAKDEALVQLDRAFGAFTAERALWRQGMCNHVGGSDEGGPVAADAALAPAPAALGRLSTSPNGKTTPAAPTATANVSRLLEALTAEVRYLKQQAKARAISNRSQHDDAATQTDDAVCSDNHQRHLVSAEGAEYKSALTAERDALRYQLDMVEHLLVQQQRRCLGAQGSNGASNVNALQRHLDIGRTTNTNTHDAVASTNALTAIYFTIRDVLGAVEASRMVHEVLSDVSLDEEEVTELLVRHLCYRVAAPSVPREDDRRTPQGLRWRQQPPPSAAAARGDEAERRGPAAYVSVTHPLLRGLSQSPPTRRH